MVWRQLPKLIPAGSIPVSRSTKIGRVKALPIFCCGESGREPQAALSTDRQGAGGNPPAPCLLQMRCCHYAST